MQIQHEGRTINVPLPDNRTLPQGLVAQLLKPTAGLKLSDDAVRFVVSSAHDVGWDVDRIKRGDITHDKLLAELLEGADEARSNGALAYAADLERAVPLPRTP